MTLRFVSDRNGDLVAIAGDEQVGVIIRRTGSRRACARYGSRWQEFRPSPREWPPRDTLVESAKTWLQEQHDNERKDAHHHGDHTQADRSA